VAALIGFVFVLHVGNTTLAAAARSVDRGDTARAESRARRASSWIPWSFQPWQIIGEAQLRRREFAEARRSFRAAIAKDRTDWGLWFKLAEASKGAARRRALDHAARLAPRSTEVAELRRTR
jgi:Flp pilus assembly protein TadD